ncbi:serine/threonine protein kinase [bacterium]|nr:serine/threonine protein kinase [bacterium]
MNHERSAVPAEPIAGYKLGRYLGRGGFGEVWQAEAPGGLAKAIKLAPVDSGQDGVHCRELDGLRKIREVRHPYLLSIERFEIVDGYLVIVMELADQSLADRFRECARLGLPGIPREELLHYLREAAEVLDLLNQRHGLQHLDVKPENLFLCGDHVKVADFGLVQPRNTNVARSAIAISPPYAPPELFDGRIEPTADQYSLAVTYQELLSGHRPYSGVDVRGLMLQHLKGRPDLSSLPPADRPIISRAIQREPEHRYQTCTELVAALTKSAGGAPSTHGERAASLTPTPSRRLERPNSKEISAATPGRQHSVRASIVKQTSDSTISEALSGSSTGSGYLLGQADSRVILPPELAQAMSVSETVESTFVAFIPTEIYAHKLRGFIDAMSGDVLHCSPQKTVLYMGSKSWFGRPTSRGMFLLIDTFSRMPHSGFRVVDVSIWSAGRQLSSADLGRRGMLLVKCLKAYLMAHDDNPELRLQTDAEVRSAVLA